MNEAQERMWRNWPQCERCKDWQRRGLSNYCPTCDRARLDEFERLKDQGGEAARDAELKVALDEHVKNMTENVIPQIEEDMRPNAERVTELRHKPLFGKP